jgi:hypothetical protein
VVSRTKSGLVSNTLACTPLARYGSHERIFALEPYYYQMRYFGCVRIESYLHEPHVTHLIVSALLHLLYALHIRDQPQMPYNLE